MNIWERLNRIVESEADPFSGEDFGEFQKDVVDTKNQQFALSVNPAESQVLAMAISEFSRKQPGNPAAKTVLKKLQDLEAKVKSKL